MVEVRGKKQKTFVQKVNNEHPQQDLQILPIPVCLGDRDLPGILPLGRSGDSVLLWRKNFVRRPAYKNPVSGTCNYVGCWVVLLPPIGEVVRPKTSTSVVLKKPRLKKSLSGEGSHEQCPKILCRRSHRHSVHRCARHAEPRRARGG